MHDQLYNDLRAIFMMLGDTEDEMNLGKELYKMSDRLSSIEDWNVLVCAINTEIAAREKAIRSGLEAEQTFYEDRREIRKQRATHNIDLSVLYYMDD